MESYYGTDNTRPTRPFDGSCLSSHVVSDDCPTKTMMQVETDAVPISSSKEETPIKKKPGMDLKTYGDDTVESSGMDSMPTSNCKYPIEADPEIGDSSGKGSPIDDAKAKRVQDEEISSSSKPREMEMDENGFPVGLEKMKFADVIIPEDEYPDWKKEGQYDGLLVYHEKDEKCALEFLEKVQRHKRPDGTPLRISYLQQIADEAGKNENEKLEYYCNKSTYLMMFLTKNFCEDLQWMYFYQHRIVIHSVTDMTKRWCAIPIHTEYWRKPKSYKTPFALQGIRGICLEDSHWEEGAERMFRERFKLLKDRLYEENLKFKRWYMREQGTRLIKWKKDKKLYLEKLKKDEEEMQKQLEAGESEPMEQDMPHPSAPGVQVQRNVGASAERSPPRAPGNAWTTPAQNASAAATGTAVQPPATMSPEQLQQMFMAIQQNPQLLQSLQGLSGGQGPVINISADVVNFGNQSQTTIQKPGEGEDDDDDY
ncbi:uncharacterized protein LOC135482444 [Lineus longissimus]|uniref:uncharacterized protein LOC135482444 n=1 Tax=Lineus longissimus TaxID=88925 RepID=UPI002B4D80F3